MQRWGLGLRSWWVEEWGEILGLGEGTMRPGGTFFGWGGRKGVKRRG